jgi:hypothetical protein
MLVVHAHGLRPAPCRLPRTLAASSKAGGSLQAIPSPSRFASRLLVLGAGKMRLPDFCNRPTTRAPNGLPDSRARRSSDLAAFRSWPTRPRPMASGGSPGGASLDGEPPASASSPPPAEPVWGRGPKRPPGRALRGPGGAWIESSSALRLPAAALSTASRACDVASDALCRGPLRAAPAFRPNPPGKNRQARLHRRLVKDDGFVEARTPSIDECSLPRRAACATLRDRREPATVLAASPPRSGF